MGTERLEAEDTGRRARESGKVQGCLEKTEAESRVEAAWEEHVFSLGCDFGALRGSLDGSVDPTWWGEN